MKNFSRGCLVGWLVVGVKADRLTRDLGLGLSNVVEDESGKNKFETVS